MLLKTGLVGVPDHTIEDRPVWSGQHDGRVALDVQGTRKQRLAVGVDVQGNEPAVDQVDDVWVAERGGVEPLAPEARLGAEVEQQRPPGCPRLLPGGLIVTAPVDFLPRDRYARRDQERQRQKIPELIKAMGKHSRAPPPDPSVPHLLLYRMSGPREFTEGEPSRNH